MPMNEQRSGGHLRSFLSGAAFSGSAVGVSALLTMLTGVIFARWLKPEGFGTYSLIVSVASFGASVGAAGMDFTVARYVCFYLGSDEKPLIRTVIRYGMRWGLTLSAAAALGAFALLSSGWLRSTKLAGLVPFAACLLLAIPALAAQAVLLQAILALQAVKTRVVLEKIAHPLLRLVLPFAVLRLFHDRTMAAAAGLVLAAVLMTLAASLILQKRVRSLPPPIAPSRAARKEWSSYALPYVFFSMQNFISSGMGLDILLVSALASISDSGVYAACFRFTLGLTLARAGMDYAFGPKVGQLFGKSDFAAIGKLYRTSAAVGLAWALPLAVVLICCSRLLMATFFGAGYENGNVALAVLVIGFAADGAAGCCTTLLSMVGKPWLVLSNGLVGGVLALGFCVLLIPRYGMVGAAAAVSVARCAATAMGTVEIWRLYGFHPFSSSSAKLLFAGISAGILGFFCKGLVIAVPTHGLVTLGFVISAVLLTYLAALCLTRFSIQTS